MEATWRPSRRGVHVLWLALVGVALEPVLLGTYQAGQASLSSASPEDKLSRPQLGDCQRNNSLLKDIKSSRNNRANQKR